MITTYPNRRDWLAARTLSIGASDAPAILGVGYSDQNAWTVWRDKVMPPPDQGDELEEPKKFVVGRVLESAIRQLFEIETGLRCEAPGREGYKVWTHEEYEWLSCTPDGITATPDGPAVVECKNVNLVHSREWSDDPPLKSQVQVQHQLAVTGFGLGYLVGLIGGQTAVVKPIERNDTFIAALIATLADFWGYVQRREPPPVDDSIACARVLQQLHPRDNGTAIELPEEAVRWHEEIRDAEELIKQGTARKQGAQNQLRAVLGDATYGLLADGSAYSWKHQDRKAYTVAASSQRVLRHVKRLPKGVNVIEMLPDCTGEGEKSCGPCAP